MMNLFEYNTISVKQLGSKFKEIKIKIGIIGYMQIHLNPGLPHRFYRLFLGKRPKLFIFFPI